MLSLVEVAFFNTGPLSPLLRLECSPLLELRGNWDKDKDTDDREEKILSKTGKNRQMEAGCSGIWQPFAKHCQEYTSAHSNITSQ